MTIIDPTKEFFCPAPWNGMYCHLNNTKPCHANSGTEQLSPTEYLESDFLKSIKRDFIAGRVPPSCSICKNREDIGIRSTRQSTFRKVDEIDPNKYLELDSEDFTVDTPSVIARLELRTSNLCNFKCRMCNSSSSSELAREAKEYPFLNSYFGDNQEESVEYTSDASLEELKKITLDGVRTLCLTGGEPLLIKDYYDFLDVLIERNLNQNINVELFTNCSVYNPKFIDRLEKFKRVRFVMSIDGVGKTAEYARKGTIWSTVEKNIYTFTGMKDPFQIFFNTAISPYVLLDASSHAKFLMKLYEINPGIRTKCYATVTPEPLHFRNMDVQSRKKAVDEIDKALEILTVDNFEILKKEYRGIRKTLVEKDPVDPNSFINYTRILDAIRNEKFEDVFGYKLV
jgi:sulfatase maturation enzyme AslB (radical SAM superfamily)